MYAVKVLFRSFIYPIGKTLAYKGCTLADRGPVGLVRARIGTEAYIPVHEGRGASRIAARHDARVPPGREPAAVLVAQATTAAWTDDASLPGRTPPEAPVSLNPRRA